MQNYRQILEIIDGMKTSDGDGVQLTRIIGTSQLNMLDPFLLFDAFGSDKPQDYIGGFPPHPHRGFETVTYMLAGKMRHQDSAGNSGVIEKDGLQWMTAGSGIIHSEMPEQEQGMLSGLQLWVNLPASKKMTSPKYQEQSGEHIPLEQRDNGTTLKVIAGDTKNGTKGLIEESDIEAVYWDIHIPEAESFTENIPLEHNAFVYLIDGSITIGDSKQVLNSGQLAVLSKGDSIIILANQKSRLLLIAGKPLNQPVARGGPFVMNTKAELHQAFADYQSGNLV
jgi:hypothetical protein